MLIKSQSVINGKFYLKILFLRKKCKGFIHLCKSKIILSEKRDNSFLKKEAFIKIFLNNFGINLKV
jgi:hypothetical protein